MRYEPGEPILVLACGRDRYLAEVLKAEGLNEFRLEEPKWLKTIEQVSSTDVIVLGEASLTQAQAELLKGYVEVGGNLIAIRPGKELQVVCGVAAGSGEECTGHLIVEDSLPMLAGFACRPLSLYVGSACYELHGAAPVASVRCSAKGACWPAVTWHGFGRGRAAAFSYNLAENIILTRQGNPMLAGLETDGINGIRPMDLFTGGWVDTETLDINMADEQMRILSRLIEMMSECAKPLPRLWYFPDAQFSRVVLTNDGEHCTGEEIGAQLKQIEEKGAAMTVYLLDTANVTKHQVDSWAEQGHEIAAHPGCIDDLEQNAYATNPTWEAANALVGGRVREVERLYGRQTRTCANHWFVWCGRDACGNPDIAAMARIFEANGIGMDCNYTVYDNGAVQGPYLGGTKKPGNFTGSGLPMKFAGGDGTALDVYQLINNVYDQQYDENADPEGFLQCFKTLLDRSLDGSAYSWVHVKAHRSMWGFSENAVLAMLEYARSKGIAASTAKGCLDYLSMKDEAKFSDIRWDGSEFSFALDSALDAGVCLTVLLPREHAGKVIGKAAVNGFAVDFRISRAMGREYAFLTVRGGRRSRISATYLEKINKK